jgi:hypothetical protein
MVGIAGFFLVPSTPRDVKGLKDEEKEWVVILVFGYSLEASQIEAGLWCWLGSQNPWDLFF